MSRARRSFSPELLARLQGMPVKTALDLLGLYWKPDPDFKPVKNYETERLYVSIGGGVVELPEIRATQGLAPEGVNDYTCPREGRGKGIADYTIACIIPL